MKLSLFICLLGVGLGVVSVQGYTNGGGSTGGGSGGISVDFCVLLDTAITALNQACIGLPASITASIALAISGALSAAALLLSAITAALTATACGLLTVGGIIGLMAAATVQSLALGLFASLQTLLTAIDLAISAVENCIGGAGDAVVSLLKEVICCLHKLAACAAAAVADAMCCLVNKLIAAGKTVAQPLIDKLILALTCATERLAKAICDLVGTGVALAAAALQTLICLAQAFLCIATALASQLISAIKKGVATAAGALKALVGLICKVVDALESCLSSASGDTKTSIEAVIDELVKLNVTITAALSISSSG